VTKSNVIILATVMGLTACGSTLETPDHEFNKNMPDWVINPDVKQGVASSVCVPSTGNLTTDRAKATAMGRAELAQQIDIRVKALDKTYQEKVSIAEGDAMGATFSSVSKQLTNQAVSGARVIKSSYAEFDGKRQLCVLSAIEAGETQKLFSSLVSSTGTKLQPELQQSLYQEFLQSQKSN